jgi:uncharacterized protein YycO
MGQIIVLEMDAAKGWTSIVPMNINDDGLTDLLSYNASTGKAVYSVAHGVSFPGQQQIVAEVDAAKGWTSIVPMNINDDGLTDLLSYNAINGRAVYSVATFVPGQQIVAELDAAQGWTSIIPMNINGDGLTDLLSYNANTGKAVYSVATGVPGQQQIVAELDAAKGWTSIVPMNINGDALTDLLSYNANTGKAVYSVGS